MRIGKRIHIYRKLKHLTLVQLAGQALSTAHLSKVENNYRQPGVGVLKSIAENLLLPSRFFMKFAAEDPEVNYLLSQIQYYILTDMHRAGSLIDMIDEHYYSYLTAVHQEVHFLLLKGTFYYKKGNINRSLHLYQTYIEPYVLDEEISDFSASIQEAYHYFFGTHHYQQGCHQASLDHFQAYFILARSLQVKAALVFNMALASRSLGDIDGALKHCNEALRYYESLNQPEDISTVFSVIAVTYWSSEEYDKAMTYLDKAENISLEQENLPLLAQIYHNKGIILRKQNSEQRACRSLEKAVTIKKSINIDCQTSLRSLCRSYLNLGRLDDAHSMFQEANALTESVTDYYKLLDSFLDYYKIIGKENNYQHSLEKCITHFSRTEELTCLKNLYKKLGHHFYETSKYKRASECYLSYINLDD